jgi:hypothetical protein
MIRIVDLFILSSVVFYVDSEFLCFIKIGLSIDKFLTFLVDVFGCFWEVTTSQTPRKPSKYEAKEEISEFFGCFWLFIDI